MGLETASLINGFAFEYAGFEHLIGSAAARFVLLALGTALYAVIVGTFYKWLSKKELFRLKIDSETRGWTGTLKKTAQVVFFFLKYAIVFPLITFVWFLFIAVSMIFLTEKQDMEQMMIVSIAMITATRITAYYDEEIAVDVAKTLPLTLLAVMLIDPAVFSKEILVQKSAEAGTLIGKAAPFLLFMIAIEVFLRLLLGVKRLIVRFFKEELSFEDKIKEK
ncbi:Uncharacterised protein [Candidatus Gugararchaeum adminiculabundum]|nr:Uncharacterised protein [Candidatus Gugararchaeum adminiculabundum]